MTTNYKTMLMGVLCVALLALPGCNTFAPEQRTQPPVPLPSSYTLYDQGDRELDQWWRAFGDAEVDALIQEALARNFDIRAAWARLAQAQATARRAAAGLYPSLDAQGEARQQRTYAKPQNQDEHKLTETENYDLGLAASYEVDLWNKISSEQKAQVLAADAALEDVQAAAVTVSAEIADAWAGLMAVRAAMRVLDEQIKVNQTLLDLQILRFENGLSQAVDVSQQRENLAAVKSDVPRLKAQEQTFLTTLALLTGKAGARELQISGSELPVLIDLPQTGLPADLLAKRPDVRAAGFRLDSADWQVSAARADRLPSLNLAASAAYSAASFDLLFSNWVTTLAASITAPIFDGGARKAEVERTRAVADERLADYARVVAQAVKEVEDSLSNEATQRELIDRLGEELEAAKQTRLQARISYLNGDSDYLVFLTGVQNVQRIERQLITEQANLVRFRIALYRALGGGWGGQPQSLAASNEHQETTTTLSLGN
jgi:NodT family efflux transporter outer membrane factor (OMF) lipoprotein